MPIEIKELHIKVALTSAPPPPASTAGDARDAIVADCVEQVLQILQNKAER